MKRINFYLTDKEIGYLKKKSKKTELPVSDLLRRILDKEINEEDASKKQKK